MTETMTLADAFVQAIAHHQAGRLPDAERLYRAVLDVQPQHTDANHNMGVLAVQVGKTLVALPYFKVALEADPSQGQYWLSYIDVLLQVGQHGDARQVLTEGRRGGLAGPEIEALAARADAAAQGDEAFSVAVANHHAGRLAEAEMCYREVLALNPQHAAALSNLGFALQSLGRLEEAEASCRRALEIKPDYAEAHSNLGNALCDLGRLEEAVASYRRALENKPDLAEAHSNLGNTLRDLGRPEEAVACYRRAVEIRPDYADAHSSLGNALRVLDRLEEAARSYRHALEVRPDLAEVHNNLGLTLQDLGRPEEAETSYRRALEIKPDLAEVHNNLGITLQNLGRLEKAEASFRRALEIKPDYADAHCNLGFCLEEHGNQGEAIACYERALSIESNHHLANLNRAIVWLRLENFERGWPAFEWRWLANPKGLAARSFSESRWQGEDLLGKTLLVHAEQGLGDTIQFARYLALLACRADRVIFELPRRLIPLLREIKGCDFLVSAGGALPPFDVQVPLMSIPAVLRTTAATIPVAVPYLQSDPQRVATWHGRLPVGFRIGIAWQGNPTLAVDCGRSIPLHHFVNLARIPSVCLISLQKIHGMEQIADLPPDICIHQFGSDFDEDGAFLDTAAVMMNVDLVITSDTSIAHLAGALGRPVWIALKAVPDWRWSVDREDCPWYPTARLFRQSTRGDWDTVFMQIANSLRKIVPSDSNGLNQ